MDGYTPESTYPFANYVLVVGSQLWLLTIGGMFSWTTRIVTGFLGAAVICAAIPYLACFPNGWNYWICFIVLIPYGAFSGVA